MTSIDDQLPADHSPTDRALDFYVCSLSTEDLARYYGRVCDRIATLEDWLGQEREHRSRIGPALCGRLGRSVGPHALEVDGHSYRAHRDGQGVHRRKIDRTDSGGKEALG